MITDWYIPSTGHSRSETATLRVATAPASPDSPITAYIYQVSISSVVSNYRWTPGTTITVTSVPATGFSRTFDLSIIQFAVAAVRVRAVNINGEGPWSAISHAQFS